MKKILSRVLNIFLRMRIGRQLTVAFALQLALIAVLGAVSLVSLARTADSAGELAEKWLASVGYLAEARTAIVELRELEVKHSATQDRSYHAEYEEKMAAAAKVVNTALTSYKALAAGEEEVKLQLAFEKSWAAYQKSTQQVIALGREKKQADAAGVSDGASSMAVDESLGALSAVTKYSFEGGRAAADHAHATHARARRVVAGLLAISLVVGAAMALLITRGLLGQLGGEPRVAVQLARAVAEGDLSTAVTVKAGDVTSLMAALQAMQASLTDTVHKVRQGSESVATASSEIAEGNLDLSGRTEQQAGALQQTAATMDELGATVRNNAENARQADQLARGAAVVATKGGSMVGQVVQTMKGINDSSRKIADIISVIDSIAFQTNILALNAAVEAARAGSRAAGLPWWRVKCAAWPSAVPRPPRRSRRSSRPAWNAWSRARRRSTRPAARWKRSSRPSAGSAPSWARSAAPAPSRARACCR